MWSRSDAVNAVNAAIAFAVKVDIKLESLQEAEDGHWRLNRRGGREAGEALECAKTLCPIQVTWVSAKAIFAKAGQSPFKIGDSGKAARWTSNQTIQY